jgi:ABC-2 type transport system ATP-binding protein
VHLEQADDAERAIAVLAELSDEEPVFESCTVRAPLQRRSGIIAEAVRRLDDAGVTIDDIAVNRPTLDDVFITLTGRSAEEAEEEDEATEQRDEAEAEEVRA